MRRLQSWSELKRAGYAGPTASAGAGSNPGTGSTFMTRKSQRRRTGLVVFVIGFLVVVVGAFLVRLQAQGSDSIHDYFSKAWTVLPRGDFGSGNIEVRRDPSRRFGRILRVHYPKGSASPQVSREGAPLGGAQAYIVPSSSAPADALHLRYHVRFPAGFDFVKGGKLPGLYGGVATSGGRVPDGTNGFSTRYMWRRRGDGEVYAYLPTSREHGTSLGRGSWRFAPGRWQALEQEVILNSPGSDDGRVRVWVDDRLVLDRDRLRFRDTASLRIDGLFFSSFFGGGDESWSTPFDTYVDFARFSVGRRFLGSGAKASSPL